MKSEREIDTLMRQALAPEMEPGEGMERELREKLLLSWDKGETISFNPEESANSADWRKNMGYKRKIWAAATAAACVLVMSVTAVATVKYLSRDEILDEMMDAGAQEAFEKGEVLEINQVIESGDYLFTLYGVATRETLAENDLDIFSGGNSRDEGNTFVVLSIAYKDGTPMPSTHDPEYNEIEFFVSPLIQGLDPFLYNAIYMGGGYGEMERNGVLYRIMECDDIALFADRELYLCITDSTFYKKNAFLYNEVDGTITPNEDYEGVNVLFNLPIDASRADAGKAEEYLKRLDARVSGEGELETTVIAGEGGSEPAVITGNPEVDKVLGARIQNGRLESGDALIDMIVNNELAKGTTFESLEAEENVWGYLRQIPLESIIAYGVLDEASVKEAEISDGIFSYSYFQPDGSDGWSHTGRLTDYKNYFAEKNGDVFEGGIFNAGINGGMGGPDGTRITVELLDFSKDGSITGYRYVITEESARAAIAGNVKP